MTTKKMAEFIRLNETLGVVAGQALTPERREPMNTADHERVDRVRYTFENGQVRTLRGVDLRSAPDYEPRWNHGS